MNARRLRQLNILMLISIGICLAVMGIFAFVLSPREQNSVELQGLKTMNDTWVLQPMGGQSESLIDLPAKVSVKQGEIVTISHMIPEDAGTDAVLFFHTEFQNVVVSLNGNRIYEDGVLSGQKLLKNTVPKDHLVSLEKGKPGDIVIIQLVSGYPRYGGVLREVYYGSRGDVISHMLRQHGVAFVVAFVLMIVVLLLGFSMLFMNNMNIDKKKAGYGFGFIFVAAFWTMLDNPMIQLVMKNQFAVFMCGNVLLLLMPMLYLMYLRCFALKKRYAQIFEFAIYGFGLNLLTGLVFQLVGVCDFLSYSIFTKILIVLCLVLLCGIMYLAADTYSDKTIYSNLWANVIVTVGLVVEFVLGFFSFYKNYDGVALRTGLFLFAILLMISIEKTVIQEMNEEKNAVIRSIGHEKSLAVGTINASYIYSAMNTAISSLRETDVQNSRLIYDTSVFMQRNMNAVNKTEIVPFAEELEYIQAYLGMARRIYEGLEVSVEDKVIDFKVPYNSIEPIVENSVVNGALTAQGQGRIVVRSYERLDCFAIQIVDNGRGDGPTKKFTGVQSFKEIRRRLKESCGAGIEIKNKPDKGTIVTIKIPKEGYEIKE